MKFFLQIILSFFLAINMVAPYVISLFDFDENMELVLDQSEDDNKQENKEGEKENDAKDTFYHVWRNTFSSNVMEYSMALTYYLEGYHNPSLNIFLPPPELS